MLRLWPFRSSLLTSSETLSFPPFQDGPKSSIDGSYRNSPSANKETEEAKVNTWKGCTQASSTAVFLLQSKNDKVGWTFHSAAKLFCKNRRRKWKYLSSEITIVWDSSWPSLTQIAWFCVIWKRKDTKRLNKRAWVQISAGVHWLIGAGGKASFFIFSLRVLSLVTYTWRLKPRSA